MKKVEVNYDPYDEIKTSINILQKHIWHNLRIQSREEKIFYKNLDDLVDFTCNKVGIKNNQYTDVARIYAYCNFNYLMDIDAMVLQSKFVNKDSYFDYFSNHYIKEFYNRHFVEEKDE